MSAFAGIKVYQNPYLPERVPRMKLAPGDYVSDEMRAKTDAWLLEFFGTESYVLVSQDSGSMFLHPNVLLKILEKFP